MNKILNFVTIFTIIAVSMISSVALASSQQASTSQSKDFNKAVLWSLFIPGGGHFYLGDHKKGFMYLLGEIGLYLAGCQVEDKLEENEQNIFYIYALKLHELGIFTTYRNARLKYSNDSYGIPIDKTLLSDLALSPFKWENIKSPDVYNFFLAGIILNVIESSLNRGKGNFSNISEVQVMGKRFDRNFGLAAYGGLWFPLSVSAAVSEECLWRGMIQTQYEEAMGKNKGLIVSSLLFGLSHISKPTEIESWADGALASLGGFYLGQLYQKENYKLEKSIAAHFWFNVGAGITTFLLDPKNNPLGLKVTFTF